jgi:hypothetical protein
MSTHTNSKIVMRAGSSYARGTTVDLYLNEQEVKALYERWDRTNWGEPYSLQGGEEAITCEMVCNVPITALTEVYGKGLAHKLFTEARIHSII